MWASIYYISILISDMGPFINYVREKGGEGGQEILTFPYKGEGGYLRHALRKASF